MTLSELLASYGGEDTAQARLDWLQESVSVVGAIGSRTLLRWAAAGARITRMRDAAANHVSDDIRSVASAAVITIERADTELDMSDAEQVALVDALVSGGVLTVDEKAELMALATTQVPRWQANGVSPEPNIGDIERMI